MTSQESLLSPQADPAEIDLVDDNETEAIAANRVEHCREIFERYKKIYKAKAFFDLFADRIGGESSTDYRCKPCMAVGESKIRSLAKGRPNDYSNFKTHLLRCSR